MTMEILVRDELSEQFFDAAARGELMIKSCAQCGTLLTPSAARCTRCSATELVWVTSPGRGALVSWVAPHVKVEGGTEARDAIAIVELDEGPWLHVHVAGELISLLDDADRVTVGFDPIEGGEPLPSLRLEAYA